MITTFSTRVNNIPCRCRVTNYEPAVPMRITGSGTGDCDPPEPAQFDFELLDSRGRRAEWLGKYLSPAVAAELFEEFEDQNR